MDWASNGHSLEENTHCMLSCLAWLSIGSIRAMTVFSEGTTALAVGRTEGGGGGRAEGRCTLGCDRGGQVELVRREAVGKGTVCQYIQYSLLLTIGNSQESQGAHNKVMGVATWRKLQH